MHSTTNSDNFCCEFLIYKQSLKKNIKNLIKNNEKIRKKKFKRFFWFKIGTKLNVEQQWYWNIVMLYDNLYEYGIAFNCKVFLYSDLYPCHSSYWVSQLENMRAKFGANVEEIIPLRMSMLLHFDPNILSTSHLFSQKNIIQNFIIFSHFISIELFIG